MVLLWLAPGLAAARDDVPREVRLRREHAIPLNVGLVHAPFVVGSHLFAAVRGSGLWVWPLDDRGETAPQRVATFGQVRSVFPLGDGVGAHDMHGVLALDRDDKGKWQARRLVLQANVRRVGPAGKGRFFVLAGEQAHLYALDGAGARSVHSWNGREHFQTFLARLARENPKAARETRINIGLAVLSGKLLLLDMLGHGMIVMRLKADWQPDTFERPAIGRLASAAPYRGTILAATSAGIYLIPSPAPLGKGPKLDILDAAGANGPALGAASGKGKSRMPVQLFAGRTDWLKVCRKRLVFRSGEQLLAIPLAPIDGVIDFYAGGTEDALEEPPDLSRKPEATLLAELPPKARFAVNDAATALYYVADGQVMEAALGKETAIRPRRQYGGVRPDSPLALDDQHVFLGVAGKLGRFDFASGANATPTWLRLAAEPARITTVLLHDGALFAAWGSPAAAGIARIDPQTMRLGPALPVAVKRLWPFGAGKILAQPAADDGLLVLDSHSLATQQHIRFTDGFSAVGVDANPETVAVLGRFPKGSGTKEDRSPEYACRLVPPTSLAPWRGRDGGAGWHALPGNQAKALPIADKGRAFIASSDTYRPAGYCLGPDARGTTRIPFLGGVFDVATADRLAFAARGLYGITVHDMAASDQFLWVGGVSETDTSFHRLALSPKRRLAALGSKGVQIYSWEAAAAKAKVHRASLPATGQANVLMDAGVDVTSWDYANLRGYATPLVLKAGPLPEEGAAVHGAVHADPKTGQVRFPAARMKPVKLRAVCELPHSYGTMALFNRDVLMVGGNEGMNLEWWDIADPARPRFMRRVEPSVGPPAQIKVRGNLVYLISNIWGGGLYIYDLSDPMRPIKLAGKVGLGERHASFCLADGRAFVRLRLPGATIVTADVRLPGAGDKPPAYRQIPLLGKTELPIAQAAALPPPASTQAEVRDDAIPLDIGEEPGGIGIAVAPTLPRDELVEGGPQPMVLHRRHLFLTSHWTAKRSGAAGSALFVLPIGEKTPGKPIVIQRLDVVGRGLGVWGDRLYVLGSSLPGKAAAPRVTLDTYDISDPSRPRRVHRWQHQRPAADAGRFTLADGRLCCYFDGQARVFDLRGKVPRLLASHDLSELGSVYHFDGSRLFVQDTRTGIAIVDLAEPETPRQLGRVLAADGWGGGIDVWRGVAYVGSEGGNIVNYQLQIVDVADPLKPRLADLLAQFDRYSTPLAWGGEPVDEQQHPPDLARHRRRTPAPAGRDPGRGSAGRHYPGAGVPPLPRPRRQRLRRSVASPSGR